MLKVKLHQTNFLKYGRCVLKIFSWFGLVLNFPVNNFSVMLGRSHCFLGITSTFGGKDTTWRPEWGSNPRPLDPESEVLTTRPPRPLKIFSVFGTICSTEAECDHLHFSPVFGFISLD